MMNFETQKALARLIHTLRADWDVDGIMSALGRAREAGKADDVRAIADASVAAALDARNRTPAVIPLAGPHWEARRATSPVRRVSQTETCGICSLDRLVCEAVQPRSHRFKSVADVRREADSQTDDYRQAREQRRAESGAS